MPLTPTRLGNVSLEYTSSDDIDFDNDYVGIASAANSGKTAKTKAKWLRDAIDPPLQQYDYIANTTLAASQTGSLITNLGAVAAITLTLPPAIAGREFAVMRIPAFAITVTSVGSDSIREGADAGSYVITNREMTVFSCIVDGTWEIIIGGAFIGRYSVRAFGAVGNGIADDTAAAQAAYDACPVGGWVVWPTGTYKITAQLNLRKNFVTTEFQGGGEDGGVNLGTSTGTGCCILHLPTAAGTLFDIANAAPSVTQLNSPSFYGNALIYSTDTTYSKTAFKFSNVSRPYFAGRIHIAGATGQGSFYTGSTGGSGGSVGVYVLGREQYNFDNMLIYAQVPLRFGKNPDSSGYDMDHVYVSNAILCAGSTAPITLIHSCILIDDDVRLSVATFDGHMALVLGKHKLYWKPTSNLTASGRLTLRNILTEQETDATAYAIHVEIPDASAEDLESLTLENCLVGADQYGVYTKNVSHIWFNGVNSAHTTGQKLLKCEGDSAKGTLSVGWDNLCLQATAPSSLIELPTDLILSYASQVGFGSTRVIPSSARYTKNSSDLGARRAHMRSGDGGVYTYYATLAPAAQYKIPANSDQRGVVLGWIDVAACSDTVTNTILIGGRVVIAATDGGTSGAKIAFQDAGGLLEVGAATAGKLSITSGARIAADLVITNNHATETLKVMVQAHYYSSTWA